MSRCVRGVKPNRSGVLVLSGRDDLRLKRQLDMEASNTTPRTVGFNVHFLGNYIQVLNRKMIYSDVHYERITPAPSAVLF